MTKHYKNCPLSIKGAYKVGFLCTCPDPFYSKDNNGVIKMAEGSSMMKLLKQNAMMEEAIATSELAEGSVETWEEDIFHLSMSFIEDINPRLVKLAKEDEYVLSGEKIEDKIQNLLAKVITHERTPMGASQWEAHGEKYGYAVYFMAKALKAEHGRLTKNIGMLRQWLNERVDKEKLITSEDIKSWLQ